MSDTGGVPPALRSRIALIVLLGAFLIPIGQSSLRGLTHVLTCSQKTELPFTLVTPEHGDPVIVSSRSIVRGQPEGVCGGLVLDMGARPAGPGRVALRLPITNKTKYDWQGTVKLKIGSAEVPVDIGEVKAGRTATDTVKVKVSPGQLELNGSLLIGP